jgi:hypothetical protein
VKKARSTGRIVVAWIPRHAHAFSRLQGWEHEPYRSVLVDLGSSSIGDGTRDVTILPHYCCTILPDIHSVSLRIIWAAATFDTCWCNRNMMSSSSTSSDQTSTYTC